MMRREDRRMAKQVPHRRLAGFKKVYEEAASTFLATLDESRVKGKSEHGYFNMHIDYEIMNVIGDEWRDIKEELRAYRVEDEMRKYRDKALSPIDETVKEQVKQWWKKTWRPLNLDFRGIPPAPKGIDLTPKKLNQRMYQVGQFRLMFEGSKQCRQCYVMVGKVTLWKERVPGFDLKDISRGFPAIMPILKSLSRLCDWYCFQELSQPQQTALWKRIAMMHVYYCAPEKRVSIDQKIDRSFNP